MRGTVVELPPQMGKRPGLKKNFQERVRRLTRGGQRLKRGPKLGSSRCREDLHEKSIRGLVKTQNAGRNRKPSLEGLFKNGRTTHGRKRGDRSGGGETGMSANIFFRFALDGGQEFPMRFGAPFSYYEGARA